MKILLLEHEGFRSLNRFRWEPGQLNIITGKCGSGKSNILRVLDILRMSARGKLGSYLRDIGGIEENLWNGKASYLSTLVKIAFPGETDQGENYLTYELILTPGDAGQHRIYWERLSHCRDCGGDSRTALFGGSSASMDGRESSMLLFDKDTRLRDGDSKDSTLKKETLLSAYGNQSGGNKLIRFFQRYVSSWTVLTDISYSNSAPVRQPAFASSEDRISADGGNLASVLHTLYSGDKNFKFEINSAMRAAFGNDFEELVFPPVSDQRISLGFRWRHLDGAIPIQQVSESILRYLLIITVLANPTPAPVIVIDEPEAGLHPGAISLIAEYASAVSSRSQVFFSSHSPRFLTSFEREKVEIYETCMRNGESEFRFIDHLELGSWLRGYAPRRSVTPEESVILDSMEMPLPVAGDIAVEEDELSRKKSALLDTTVKIIQAEEIIRNENLEPAVLEKNASGEIVLSLESSDDSPGFLPDEDVSDVSVEANGSDESVSDVEFEKAKDLAQELYTKNVKLKTFSFIRKGLKESDSDSLESCDVSSGDVLSGDEDVSCS